MAKRRQPEGEAGVGRREESLLPIPIAAAILAYGLEHAVLGTQQVASPVQTTMVAITLVAAAINLNDRETNAIKCTTHFVLFVTFIMLAFFGL